MSEIWPQQSSAKAKNKKRRLSFAMETVVVYQRPRWIRGGVGAVVRSLLPNPEVPGSIPGQVEGWIFGCPFFPLEFTQLSLLPWSVKWVPAYMDRFEAAARGTYINVW